MNKKSNKGITLIALVVTIVVLIILVGIGIGSLGDNGIIDEAHKAKQGVEIDSIKDQIELAIMEVEQNNLEPTLTDVIQKLIDKEVISQESQVNTETGDITSDGGYVIKGMLNDYITK